MNNYYHSLLTILFFIVFFGGIYIMYNKGNMAIFIGKTTTIDARIDSIKLIHGLRGRGYNQQIFYRYNYKDNVYNSYFINKKNMWNYINDYDSLKLKISTQNPINNKVIGVYFIND